MTNNQPEQARTSHNEQEQAKSKTAQADSGCGSLWLSGCGSLWLSGCGKVTHFINHNTNTKN